MLDQFLNSSVNTENWKVEFENAEPFQHVVIDNFFRPEVADQLASEFPDFNSPVWYSYNNAIENKRASNAWDRFPKATYSTFAFLNSPEFVTYLELNTGIKKLSPDVGLHGGGWHAHTLGGKLNIHLDYSIHPKLQLERRLNLIVYLTKDWSTQWGGGLQLWSHDSEKNQPKACEKQIENRFNRAVLFDTTQNSWHGLPDALQCPDGVVRRSIAVYYLTPPRQESSDRAKALFAPHKDQKDNPEVLRLIEQRANIQTFASVYRERETPPSDVIPKKAYAPREC